MVTTKHSERRAEMEDNKKANDIDVGKAVYVNVVASEDELPEIKKAIYQVLYYERIRGNCKNGYMVTTGQHEEHKEEDRMKESTKESIDKAIEDVSSQIRKLDISDTDYADNVRALAALISARAQISD